MLVLLTWIALRQMAPVVNSNEAKEWRLFSWLGITLLLIQIMLGGWMSSNFAALACNGFPLCHGALIPPMDFAYSNLPLSVEKLTTMHWMHRAGAFFTVSYLCWLSIKIMAVKDLRSNGITILILVALQSVLGILNVLLSLPLLVAVLHNAVAMLLLVALVTLSYRLKPADPLS